ncbi:hypothetical protein F4806DRAFT_477454 [Annulohypoxylon nitens]|nr:hypothetical protein F4806DRAFT_477454 [Annulohypoxylon nitens]
MSPGAIDERNIQVGLMHDIYKKASEVLIWLRQENEPSADEIAYSLFFLTYLRLQQG